MNLIIGNVDNVGTYRPQRRPGSEGGDYGARSLPAVSETEPTNPTRDPLTPEGRELEEMQARDREVRQHEAAHVAAGGAHVRGGASFSYRRGPDGRSYAVGGEVQIDSSAVPNDPEATIRKMRAVQAAAMAPAEPSGQDRSVAAQAAQAATQARAELTARGRSEGRAHDPASVALTYARNVAPSSNGQALNIFA